MHFIFDLDHTVIDSSHRQLTRADGSLNLDHWRENCTREAIMADQLLPMARVMQGAIENGLDVIICTARVLSVHDIAFLIEHGLYTDNILSRPEGDASGDADLKVRLLTEHAASRGMSFRSFTRWAYMWDDNKNVLRVLREHGIKTYCAIEANNKLKAA